MGIITDLKDMWTKKLHKQILNLAVMGLTVSRKFMEILNPSEQKDSYHTMKDLEVKSFNKQITVLIVITSHLVEYV